MNFWWLLATATGALILAASIHGARGPIIPPAEARVFHRINGLPDWLLYVLWLPMQLGNLVVGTLVGLVLALVDGDLAVAIGVMLAAMLKLVAERLIRKRMAPYLPVRQRPGTSEPGAHLRGDVPASGPSFPSGHIILVAAVGMVVSPNLHVALWPVPVALILLVMIGRVFVGAHNPLDVTAGLGAGLVLGGVLAAFVS
jgi:undecaprenyl-diphosphatase